MIKKKKKENCENQNDEVQPQQFTEHNVRSQELGEISGTNKKMWGPKETHEGDPPVSIGPGAGAGRETR